MEIRPVSITHQHLLSVVHTECLQKPNLLSRPLRLLDLGCGDGSMLAFLASAMPRLRPDLTLELYGCDVHDSRIQPQGFLEQTVAGLEAAQFVLWTGVC